MGFFTDLFGNKSTDAIYSKIDQIIDRLPLKQNDQQFDNLVANALKDIVDYDATIPTEKNKNKQNLDEVEKLLQGITVPENRLRRYDTYDDLYKSIQIVKRIIRVYINNIFQKNPVTNMTILIKESEKSKNYEKLDNIKKVTREIMEYYKLDEKLKYTVAFNLLKYGDSFVEIIDLDDIVADFPVVTSASDESIITETYNYLNSKNPYKHDHMFIDNLDNFVDCLIEFDDNIYVDSDLELIQEDRFNDAAADASKYNLKKIILHYHRPHKIVPLLSPYDTILGYVEIKESEKATTSVNILKQFTDIIDKIGSKYPNNTEKYDKIIKDFSKLIIKKILVKNKITKKTNQSSLEYAESIRKSLDDDLYYSLKHILLSSQDDALFRKKLKIRFIKPDNMLWFRTPGSDYYPFGTSVIDPLVFPGKLFLFTNLANTVYKLSKASQIRKWVIETGSKQDHSALLQKLKKNFKNMRITASDLTNTKDLPNILSDFRDMVVFSKHGQRFIDMELLQMGDPNVKTNDLELLKQELVSLSGIPSSHLNIPEATDMREQLVNINVNMAHEISSYQAIFNEQIKILIDKIALKIGFEDPLSNFITLQLIPPSQLTLQLVEASLVSVGNIFSIFKDVPGVTINPVSLLKRYVPYIDWDVMLKEGEILNMQNKVISTDQAAQAATQFSGGQPTF